MTGYWMTGYWILDTGYWIQVHGHASPVQATAGSHRRAQGGRGTLRQVAVRDRAIHRAYYTPRISLGRPKTAVRPLCSASGGWSTGAVAGWCTGVGCRGGVPGGWVYRVLPSPPTRYPYIGIARAQPAAYMRFCVHPGTPGSPAGSLPHTWAPRTQYALLGQ